jgi:hypothetical protein
MGRLETLTIPIERLHKLFSYEPVNGNLIWRSREISEFSNIRAWKIWNKRFSGVVAGSFDADGRSKVRISGKYYKTHRIIFAMCKGFWPTDLIDHIDGNPSNNKIDNLRDANNSINQQNQRIAQAHNRSGFLGVSWSKSRKSYKAQIRLGRETILIGYFSNPELAHQAYLLKKRDIHAGCTI